MVANKPNHDAVNDLTKGSNLQLTLVNSFNLSQTPSSILFSCFELEYFAIQFSEKNYPDTKTMGKVFFK